MRTVYIFILSFLFTAFSSAAQNSFPSAENAAANVVYPAGLQADVEYLCSEICEGRASGTAGGSVASLWIRNRLAKWKLIPMEPDYYMLSRENGNAPLFHSVGGMIESNFWLDNGKYIIVCSHSDGLGRLGEHLYPGADSNASGVVATMKLAHLFSSMKMLGRSGSTSLIFILLDGKEKRSAGARDLVCRIKEGRFKDPRHGKIIREKDIRMLVNIDQIGSTLSPVHKEKCEYLLMLGNNRLENGLSETASIIRRECGNKMDLAFDYYGSKDFTELFYRLADREALGCCSCPMVFFTSGITMNNNKTRDTPDTLDYDVMKERILFIFHWLCRII
ncbi:MAG: M28 family peptidase [Bacteroidales bacterium]|nr:M28 family peptidase [Bacteroidales bacterium]